MYLTLLFLIGLTILGPKLTEAGTEALTDNPTLEVTTSTAATTIIPDTTESVEDPLPKWCQKLNLHNGICKGTTTTNGTTTTTAPLTGSIEDMEELFDELCRNLNLNNGFCKPPSEVTTAKSSTKNPTDLPDTTEIMEEADPFEGKCRSPDLKYGDCKPLLECPPLLSRLVDNPSDHVFARFLRISNENCNNEYAVVCCPDSNQDIFKTRVDIPENLNSVPTTLLTPKDGCGYLDRVFRKYIYAQSPVGGWPWLALIGYNDEGSSSSFKCGGTLITARHVITAAHCINSNLSFVRLGEHDLSIDNETMHIDIAVSKTLQHPLYNESNHLNDIAILYLERNVLFSVNITPICLPIETKWRKKNWVNYTPFVAGWGKTFEGGNTEDVLQEIQEPIYKNSDCKDLYKEHNKLMSGQFSDDAVLCAGYFGGGYKRCFGDSGGPLILPERYKRSYRFYLIGVSTNISGCKNSSVPELYTRVDNYIDWIEKEIANTL